MREPQQQQTLLDDEATLVVGGEETTLVTPRFDDEETLVARPVVPLGPDAPAPLVEREAPRPAQDYRSTYAPRRTWTLALVLVSVLVGGVLGGAGLYLYQRQSQDPAVSPAAAATTQQPPADAANEAQPAAPPQHTDVQPADAPKAEEPAPPAPVEEAPAPAREPENVPAAVPAEGAPKRGKKGERDEEIERRATSRPAGNVARAAGSIFDRPRRATRRARANDDVDRLRRIFEGSPQ